MALGQSWRVRRTDVQGVLCLSADLPGPSKNVGLLRPVAAAAVSEGVRKDTGVISWVSWPDLVTVDGSAVGKVRVSCTSKTSIAVRVNGHAPASQELLSACIPSTSILEVLGAEVDLELLSDRVMSALDWYAAELERGAYRKLVERIEPSIRWMGDSVTVRMKDGTQKAGRASGLEEGGSLLLRGRGGRTLSISPEDAECVVPIRQSPQRGSPKRNLL